VIEVASLSTAAQTFADRIGEGTTCWCVR
jgi:hypothetical protein